jgi:hypothetical protein
VAPLNNDLGTFRVPRHPLKSERGWASTAGERGDQRSSPTTSRSLADRIDLDALAAKVYDLLVQEARLERERLGRPRF